MARDAREFWRALEQRLPEAARDREREVARSVLVLLRNRLRPEEAQNLKEELPEELKELWSARWIGLAEQKTARPVADLDHNAFVEGVQRFAHLPDIAEAAKATEAVFGAVREIISEDEARAVESELPSGLKRLWRGEHPPKKGPHYEQGPSRFWEILSDRLEGQVPASAAEVACTVLAHLRGRLPADLVEEIDRELPEDVRESWVAPEPGAEADEHPERFFGRIAQDLGTTDLETAHHAAEAAMVALRSELPAELAKRVEAALPEELRGHWEAM